MQEPVRDVGKSLGKVSTVLVWAAALIVVVVLVVLLGAAMKFVNPR